MFWIILGASAERDKYGLFSFLERTNHIMECEQERGFIIFTASHLYLFFTHRNDSEVELIMNQENSTIACTH